jgi:hypothetical protein
MDPAGQARPLFGWIPMLMIRLDAAGDASVSRSTMVTVLELGAEMAPLFLNPIADIRRYS